MNESYDPIQEIDDKLNALIQNELNLRIKIDGLKTEINQLKINALHQKIDSKPMQTEPISYSQKTPEIVLEASVPKPKEDPLHVDLSGMFAGNQKPQRPSVQKKPGFDVKKDLEKFIGENLINKIGIVILVIGVGIGGRYSIEHNLISPLTRIILGYLIGIGLLTTAFRLKPKFENFSAVLLSGAMAILYLLTFLAYDLYQLIPQIPTFGIMVFFTGFTVYSAIQYNRQIIAHLGLVGAYAVPFLLSSGSGQISVLFTYVAILNAGILVVAFNRYWQSLHYSSLIFTWLIFFSWLVTKFSPEAHFALAMGFSTLFFALFYLSFLSFKLIRNQVFEAKNLLLILLNATVFFFAGISILAQKPETDVYEGLFTFLNALVHFAIASFLYLRKRENKTLLVMLAGLVVVFITIAIPVQLEGNFVTVLWIAFATFLFWLGRKYEERMFHVISTALLILALISLIQDWENHYDKYTLDEPTRWLTPVFNAQFLSSFLFLTCLGFFWKINKQSSIDGKTNSLREIFIWAIPGLFLLVLFGSGFKEVSNYWVQLYQASRFIADSDLNSYNHYGFDPSFQHLKEIWQIHFSLLFWGLIALVNSRKLKNPVLSKVTIALNLVIIFQFLTLGLSELDDLQNLYFRSILPNASFTGYSTSFTLIRYLSFVFLGFNLWTCRINLETAGIKELAIPVFELFFWLVLLIVTSNECILWISRIDKTAFYKLGLSIFWGIYSLVLVSLGIGQKKKYLRIFAIALFGITLLKLFFFDIAHLTTILKTVVLVSLGVLLLVISFLYNKFQDRLDHE